MFSKLLVIVVMAVLAATTADTGNASDPAPTPKGVGTATMSPGHAPGEPAWVKAQEKKNLRRYLGDRRLAAAAKSCNPKPFYEVYTYQNASHTAVLFRYYEQVYYCTAGGLVTYFYRYRWPKMSSIVPIVDWNPWSFDGNINSGNECSNEHCFIRNYKAPSRTAVTKGSFSVCALKFIGWCNHIYPTITITVYGDGSKPYGTWTTG